jgi:hypothetical protein
MIKFKENVTGFIYDSINGDIMEIFTTKIPKNIWIVGEDNVLFVKEDINDIIDMFCIESKEDLNGLEEVLEWVE